MKVHNFRKESAKAVSNGVLRAAIRKTANALHMRKVASLADYPEFEALRDWGRSRKLEVSGNLAERVQEFTRQVEAAGGVVHFAKTREEAAAVVTRIARERGVRAAVKSKSMTTEEIGLNEALAEAGVTVTETDLGEFIIQIAGEKPSHILAPAIHRDRVQVGKLFHEVLGTEAGLDVEGLVAAARKALRQRFLSAEMGITGANFAIAETGTFAIVTNEGNGRMTTSLPPVHVAIIGIDKIIPKLSDLPKFLTLLTRSATGQTISSYVTIVTGPRKPGDDEGPKELHVVLLDNGRSSLTGGPFREMLHCLHCGSCLNVCPVYRTVGGHAYESVYPGPMGDVISPLLFGMDEYGHLSDACTLCGRCAEACPVRIPLPTFHRKLRNLRAMGKSAVAAISASAAASPALYKGGLKVVRSLLGNQNAALRGKLLNVPMKAWMYCREVPRPQPGPSFREWWQERKGSTR
ncbi:MAG: LutB/LldF family L-lactate oxidation iron-sulfur protein [Acidobacteriota bacterium]